MDKTEVWKQRIEEWTVSGITQSAFCTQNNIPLSNFNYWKKKIHTPTKNLPEKGLVKIPITLQSFEQRFFTIEFSLGYIIKVPEYYNSSALKRLVLDLKEICV